MGKIIYVNFKGPYRGKVIDTVGVEVMNKDGRIPSSIEDVEPDLLGSFKDEDEKDPA